MPIEFVQIPSRVATRRGMRRVAIVGMGAVGSAFAFSLVHEGRVRELILNDIDVRRAQGEMLDLSHCLPNGRPMKLTFGAIDAVTDCDLVVVTAGAAQAPGETRLDLVRNNADIIASLFPALTHANPQAVFSIITNPVDVMTRLAIHLSDLPDGRIFGTGTMLDTARFRLLLSQHLDVDPRNVDALVVGEHGDSEVLLWSRARIGPYTVDEYAAHVGRPVTAEVRAAIDRDTRYAAYQIIERKGATNFAIGVCMQQLYETMNYSQNRLHTVSRPMGTAYDLGPICLSVPCLLARDGAGPPMEMTLATEELEALRRSAETIDHVYTQLGIG